ncbi:MAG: M48 family metallopeptidase [Pseudomonadota bacterium]
MNFFQHQDDAQRQSRKLVFYFVIAVVLIIVAVNAVVFLIARFGGCEMLSTTCETFSLTHWLDQPVWLIISLITLLVIVIGSIKRMHQLRQGGDAIAEWSGATRLDMHSQKQRDRVYINVAEEMAIASGMPLPSLWVMENEGAINAFVAGLQPTEAALVVTRGCLEQLDREELQGVIGHEFSHIFHGDMRLNVRLMGVLAGILAIGQVGGMMLRSTGVGLHRRRGSSQGAFFIGGLALMAIGYIGLFFGRLIKASVSRQREYLADASAVQYTRSANGIAGALAKIRDFSFGSLLNGRRTEEMSHMCFGAALVPKFGGLLATHPPLDDRIARIDPHFEVKAQVEERAERREADAQFQQGAAVAASMGFAAMSQDVVSLNAAQVVESIGNPSNTHVEYAQALHQSIPGELLVALHSVVGAQQAVLASLLGDVDDLVKKRLQWMTEKNGPEYSDEVASMNAKVGSAWPRLRLAMVDLALPQLKRLSRDEREQFLKAVNQTIAADGRVSLFEFTLLAILRRHLPLSGKGERAATHFTFQAVEQEIAQLLNVMIRVGGDSKNADDRYARILRTFSRSEIARDSLPPISGKLLSKTLKHLRGLAPILKSSLIEALVECVLHDGHIAIKEAELLRAVSETLDCPLPPLIDTTGETQSA